MDSTELSDDKVVMEVFKCSACGKDHEQMEFTRFITPVEVNDVMWDYMGICPETNLELVLNFEEVQEVQEVKNEQ